ncbi:hypothetical protein ACE2AJ_14905 [Aquihabitans daechungensis]|uniref:hypothetical protein n=1 Tax=Aquihabitans daechungensis TaxID=1052257 RepID=UPI003B9E8A69
MTALTPETTRVEFSEVPIGPARLLAPVAAPLAVLRNTRSLEHLDRFLQDRRAEVP